jgi:hypothetical protein
VVSHIMCTFVIYCRVSLFLNLSLALWIFRPCKMARHLGWVCSPLYTIFISSNLSVVVLCSCSFSIRCCKILHVCQGIQRGQGTWRNKRTNARFSRNMWSMIVGEVCELRTVKIIRVNIHNACICSKYLYESRLYTSLSFKSKRA